MPSELQAVDRLGAKYPDNWRHLPSQARPVASVAPPFPANPRGFGRLVPNRKDR
jgi:hypothetical protein